MRRSQTHIDYLMDILQAQQPNLTMSQAIFACDLAEACLDAGGALPYDVKKLAAFYRITPSAFRKRMRNVARFFRIEGGGLYPIKRVIH